MLHARKGDLEDKIARSRILEDQDIDLTKAYVGAIVKVQNQKTKKNIVYTLVSPVEADMASGKISTQSPVGKAILGSSIGDVVVAAIPAGDLKLKVLDISR
jgi:transcription elongation factor GreA